MTNQQPIHSKFTYKSSAEDVVKGIDLTGKVAMVTGGYSGVGLETVKALSSAGATVIVPARRMDIAQEAVTNIARVEVGTLDLMDPASIDTYAGNFLRSNRPLHILINNAGIMYPPLQRDSRGHESQFSTNHLGHFQLTARLLPALKKAEGARIIAVSSRAQREGGIIWNDVDFAHTAYNPRLAYAQSKTANSLFAVELDRLAKSCGIRAFAVHPGLVPTTGIGRYSGNSRGNGLNIINTFNLLRIRNFITAAKAGFKRADYDYYKTIAQGASTQTWAATSPELNGKGGVFLEDNNMAAAVPADSTSRFGVRPWAIDKEQAKRLWTLSEEMTGVTFEF
ncbi:SDR family NAD(P)-dependent oxidoreductase [Paenibacillus thalictri]|nr:SDR family NAD(P)-dependent oxidoreductase [Paenibacillus thalictri]